MDTATLYTDLVRTMAQMKADALQRLTDSATYAFHGMEIHPGSSDDLMRLREWYFSMASLSIKMFNETTAAMERLQRVAENVAISVLEGLDGPIAFG